MTSVQHRNRPKLLFSSHMWQHIITNSCVELKRMYTLFWFCIDSVKRLKKQRPIKRIAAKSIIITATAIALPRPPCCQHRHAAPPLSSLLLMPCLRRLVATIVTLRHKSMCRRFKSALGFELSFITRRHQGGDIVPNTIHSYSFDDFGWYWYWTSRK